MKQKILIVCIAVLAVAAIVFGALFFTNDADKTKTIDALKGEKAALTDDAAAKAEQITGLTGEKEQLIADNAAAIEEKDGQIAALTGEKEKLIADNAAAIEEKDGQIAALTAEKEQLIADNAKAIEEKDGQIAALTGEKEQLIADHETAIGEKQAEIDKLAGEKAALEETVKGKDGEIEKLIGEKQQLIDDHEKAIQEKNNEIQQLKDDSAAVLAEKDSLIEELKAEAKYLQNLVAVPVVETVEAVAEEAVAEETIEAVVEEATEAVEEVAVEATETVEAVVEEATEAVEEVAEEATEAVEEVAEEVTEAVEEVIETVSAGMTYADYVAAAVDTPVEVETYVQAKQAWWDNKGTFYTQNEEGAYFIYEMAISEEDYNKLVPGTKILVKGYKGEWSGEVEIVDATFEILEGNWIAEAKDLTEVLGTDELINYQNQFAAFKGMTVEAISYKNGEPGDDIYVTLSLNGASYDFCVERYLTGPETEVYAAFADLHTGDVVDVEGFVYWYNGVNTHITKVTVISCTEEHAETVETVVDEAIETVDETVETTEEAPAANE